jgi:uncharacterized protein YoxC
VAALVVLGLAGWAMVWLGRASRSATRLLDDVGERAPALIEKADLTLDGINAELVRVDEIVNRVHDVSEAIGSTTDAAQSLVGSVGSRVTNVGAGIGAFVRTLAGSRKR